MSDNDKQYSISYEIDFYTEDKFRKERYGLLQRKVYACSEFCMCKWDEGIRHRRGARWS